MAQFGLTAHEMPNVDRCRRVESVSWCLAATHLSDGLLCVDHRYSVTVCCVSSAATGVVLKQLYNISSIDTVPQGHCYVCYTIYCCSAHAPTFTAAYSMTTVEDVFFIINPLTFVKEIVYWRRLLSAVYCICYSRQNPVWVCPSRTSFHVWLYNYLCRQ